MDNVMFLPLSLPEFENVLQKIVKEEIRNQQREQLQEKLLSPEETRKLFSPIISRGTLYNWVEVGHLKKYCLGKRTWFKYPEVIEAAKTLKGYAHI